MQRKRHHETLDKVIELPASLRRKRMLARIILVWEQLWVALWPPLGVLGLFVLSALSGLWRDLPVFIHIGALLLFAALLIFTLWPLRHLKWPGKNLALRRLEQASRLKHQPLSSLSDTLTLGLGDTATQRLWRAHKQALQTSARKLKTGWPSPGLARRDPYALRAALLLLLVPAFFHAGPDWSHNLIQPLNLAYSLKPEKIILDAWLTPPKYTARPPVFLAQNMPADKNPPRMTFNSPAGSELVIRISGTNDIPLQPEQNRPAKQKFTAKAKGVWELRQILHSSGHVQIMAGGYNIINWAFNLKPDLPPMIRLVKKPQVTPNQVLKLTYKMHDDYGVKQASAKFRLKASPATENETPPLLKPPDFLLPVPAGQEQEDPQIIYRDLTAHPWAGLVVELTLHARDEAGQETSSTPVLMRLPERVFTKPLAKAIIEQRRMLALDPENRWIAGTALDALSMAPDRFIKDYGVYLGIRAAYRALHQIRDEIDLSEVMDLLWDIALDIEGGNLSIAARNLRQAQEKLRQALEQGASDAQITRLMRQLKQALGQYLEAMRKRAAGAKSDQARQRLLSNRSIRPKDLAKMLDDLETLAKSGARDAARKMLAKLQDLLENLTANPAPHERREDRAMNEWMKNLDKLMRDQQRLQEETFSNRKPQTKGKTGKKRTFAQDRKAPPEGKKDKAQESMEAGKNGKNNKNQKRQHTLQGQQKALRQTLDGLSKQLGKMGLKAPNPFGRAGEAMRRAEKQLGKGRNGDAAGEQGKALENLRSGMRTIARQIMRRMAKNAGGGPQGNQRTDPLGRLLPSNQLGNAEKMRKGGKNGAEEAYRIRNELKRRLGERTRPRTERQYLERLLRWF